VVSGGVSASACATGTATSNCNCGPRLDAPRPSTHHAPPRSPWLWLRLLLLAVRSARPALGSNAILQWHPPMASSNGILQWHPPMASSNAILQCHPPMASSNAILQWHPPMPSNAIQCAAAHILGQIFLGRYSWADILGHIFLDSCSSPTFSCSDEHQWKYTAVYHSEHVYTTVSTTVSTTGACIYHSEHVLWKYVLCALAIK
jgi:hypothetical protein